MEKYHDDNFPNCAFSIVVAIPQIATANGKAIELAIDITKESTPTALSPGEWGAKPDGSMGWGEGTPQHMIDASPSPGGGGEESGGSGASVGGGASSVDAAMSSGGGWRLDYMRAPKQKH